MFSTIQQKAPTTPPILTQLREAANASLKINDSEHPIFIIPTLSFTHKDNGMVLDSLLTPSGEKPPTLSSPIRIASITVQSAENLESKEVVLGILQKRLPNGTIEYAVVDCSKSQSDVPPNKREVLLLLTKEQIYSLAEDKSLMEDCAPWLNGLMSAKAVQSLLKNASVELVKSDKKPEELEALKKESSLSIARQCGSIEDSCVELLNSHSVLFNVNAIASKFQLSYNDPSITPESVAKIQQTAAKVADSIGSFHGFYSALPQSNEMRNAKGISNVFLRETDTMMQVLNTAPKDASIQHYIIKPSPQKALDVQKNLHIEIEDGKLFAFVPGTTSGDLVRRELGPIDKDFSIESFFTQFSEGGTRISNTNKELQKLLGKIMPKINSIPKQQMDEEQSLNVRDGMKNKVASDLPSKDTSPFWKDVHATFEAAINRVFAKDAPTLEIALNNFFQLLNVMSVSPKRHLGVFMSIESGEVMPKNAIKFKPTTIPSRKIPGSNLPFISNSMTS